MSKISAIVLAAGRSRRMGAFKPLLPFGNRSVVESCVRNLTAAGLAETIVVVGHQAAAVKSRLTQFQVIFATNSDPDSEMSASIAIGVRAVSKDKDAVLIQPVDQPAVPPSVIAEVVGEYRRGNGKLIQPRYDNRGGHPVLIDLSFRDELLNLDPHRGLRGLFDSHSGEVHRLVVDSPYVARDMDTWEDYVWLHQDVFGRPPEIAKP